MRLNDDQIRRLSESLLNALTGRGGTTLKAERGRVLTRIEAIIRDNLLAEDELEKEARALVQQHLAQAPAGVDEHKLLLMIKKKLAEERGFPL